MQVGQGKAERYRHVAERFFEEVDVARVRRHADLNPDEVVSAICMGPNATRTPEKAVVPSAKTTVTFDVEILFARLPRPT